eukprot:CAMPEP_0174822632 /NCGR_PEP_ID=MMETSP1107-20130205/17314_1 /TAXON_ID=36770 /ORGANISM="Paraphysomonas vestita, Strain GFlagA" /LENGTH=144 /DNA_ID=CAMNT_0016042141 /DNA_START=71 /DNA_END=505 /DNA_ORIENTATION=+
MNDLLTALPHFDDDDDDDEVTDLFDDQFIEDLLHQGWSVTAIKKLAKQKSFQCMSCPACYQTYRELRTHLKRSTYLNGKEKEKCFYGTAKLDNQKADFVAELDEEGIESFKDTHTFYEHMNPAQKQTYRNLLRLTALQIKIKRS